MSGPITCRHSLSELKTAVSQSLVRAISYTSEGFNVHSILSICYNSFSIRTPQEHICHGVCQISEACAAFNNVGNEEDKSLNR